MGSGIWPADWPADLDDIGPVCVGLISVALDDLDRQDANLWS